MYRERHRTAGLANHAPGQRMARQGALRAFHRDLELQSLGDIQNEAPGTAPLDRMDRLEKPPPVNPHQPAVGRRLPLSELSAPERHLRNRRRRKERRIRRVQGNEQPPVRAPNGDRGEG